MKELSIEEKAKRYDEAIERAKNTIEVNQTIPYIVECVKSLFPELKESEDERIRNRLIAMCKHYIECYALDPYNINGYKEALAWLEKQDKQNPCESCEEPRLNCQNFPCERKKNFDSANKVKPKFKVGDIIKPKDGGHEPWQIMQVDVLDKKYRFKDGCVIHFSQEDDYELIEQKPAGWSEEDEKCIKLSTDIIDSALRAGFCVQLDRDRCVEWLKSLKPQNHWKPTIRQLTALEYAVNDNALSCDELYALNELYEQLKKL